MALFWTCTALTGIAGIVHALLILGLIRNRRRTRRFEISGHRPSPALRLSVIVPARNEAQVLPALLASLSAQRLEPLQLVFVDDGSSDDTEALLHAFTADHPRALVVRSPPVPPGINPKQSALDAGIAAADGTILLFTDADCTVPPTWVEELLRAFEDPAVGLVFGPATLCRDGRFLERFQAFDQPLANLYAFGSAGLGLATGCFGNNLAVRREALASVGGFAGLGYTLTEDSALVGAVRARGWRVRGCPLRTATIATRPEPTLAASTRQRLRWQAGIFFGADPVLRWSIRLLMGLVGIALAAMLLAPVAPEVLIFPLGLWVSVFIFARAGIWTGHRHAPQSLPLEAGFSALFVLTQLMLTAACVLRVSARWKERELPLQYEVDEQSREGVY